jgi:hypothetical protein
MAVLDSNIANIPDGSALQHLYTGFVTMMANAKESDAPDFSDNEVELDENLEPTQAYLDAVQQKLSEHTDVMMKNQAYAMANAIAGVLTPDAESGSTSTNAGYVQRAGDSMAGQLSALYGFSAGVDGFTIFKVSTDSDKAKLAQINGKLAVGGQLIVSDVATVNGLLHLTTNGLYLGDNQTLFFSNGQTVVNGGSDGILLKGNVNLPSDGIFTIGNTSITTKGIFGHYDGWDCTYWHSGNSNLPSVDWYMANGIISGNLSVEGESTFGNTLKALKGFSLGDNDTELLYSYDEQLKLGTDLDLDNHSLLLGGSPLLYHEGNVVNLAVGSMSGYSMTIGKNATYLTLAAGLKNYTNDYVIISKEGIGSFHGLSAYSDSGTNSLAFSTYYVNTSDYGVLLPKRVRLGDKDSSYISSTDGDFHFTTSAGYLSVNIDGETSKSVILNTDVVRFYFEKQISSPRFSIISDNYTTYLGENKLFFADGVAIEGVTEGMLQTGNVYYTGTLGTQSFASGFAGYGWQISNSGATVAATFDELTVRRKMRIYELEVQTIKSTNGSLWVSDSCSGDTVEKIS